MVTSGTCAVAAARLTGVGLPAPPVLVTAEDVPTGKTRPSPLPARRHPPRPRPTTCLAIEDAPAGVASARTAGCHTLALLTTHPHTALTADLIAHSLATVHITPTPTGFTVTTANTS